MHEAALAHIDARVRGRPAVAEQHQIARAQLVGGQGLPQPCSAATVRGACRPASVRYTQAIRPLQSKPPCGVLPP